MTSWAQNPGSPVPMLVCRSPAYGFVLKYAATWERQEQALLTKFITAFLAPPKPQPQFRENVVLEVEAILRPMTVEQYMQTSLDLLQRQGMKVPPPSPTTFGGHPGYRGTLLNPPNQFVPVPLQVLIVFTVRNTWSYTLSYYARQDRFAAYMPMVEEMIDSTEIK